MSTAQECFDKSKLLAQKGKYSEAIECLDKAIELDKKFMEAYRFKAGYLSAMGDDDGCIECSDQAIAVDPTYVYAYNNKGNAYKALGMYEEALEAYDKAISLDPNLFVPYHGKGMLLDYMGRDAEALEHLEKAITLGSKHPCTYQNKGTLLARQDKDQEALESYNKAISIESNHALALSNRAKLYSKLGRKAEALSDLRTVKQLIDDGYTNIYLSPGNFDYIKRAIKLIDELEESDKQAEAVVKQADQTNPVVKKFVTRLHELQKEKDKATSEIIQGVNKKGSSDDALMKEVTRIKEDYNALLKEVSELKSGLQKANQEIENVKKELGDVKVELGNKIDDFKKKLDGELEKLDIPAEDRVKLKHYFGAFIETFSSAYVTAQVITSGQVQLDSNNSKATLLSFVASFAPFVGNALSTGIKSIGDFLQSREMKKNARKMVGLASDTVELSQLLGGSAYEIVLNKTKQEQILKITNEELKKVSGSILQQISKFCENLDEVIDSFLYSDLYKTPQARLGHNDANALIEEWVNEKIDRYNTKEEFIKKALEQKKEEESSAVGKVPQAGRSSCCSMF